MRQAVVLAGGLGTRIAALSGGLPKILLPVGGRPFISHLRAWLTAEGVEEVVLLLGHKAEEVARMALAAQADIPGAPGIRQSVETSPLGTGGALRLAAPLLDEQLAQPLPEPARALRGHRQEGAVALVGHVVLLDEVADVDPLLPVPGSEALPGLARSARFRLVGGG